MLSLKESVCIPIKFSLFSAKLNINVLLIAKKIYTNMYNQSH